MDTMDHLLNDWDKAVFVLEIAAAHDDPVFLAIAWARSIALEARVVHIDDHDRCLHRIGHRSKDAP